jgi:hypothetical protein
MRHTYKVVLIGVLVALTVWLDAAALRAIGMGGGARDKGTTMVDLRVDAGRLELFRVSMLLLSHR